jgi:putative heme-binding domain-containing protein
VLSALKLIGCCLMLMAFSWAQAPAPTTGRNPFGTPEGIEEGRALFQTRCSYCHGAHGEGGRGADLTTGQFRHGGSDQELFSTIRNGIPGTEMPAVGATDDDAWKLVAFVKSLGSGGSIEQAPGDPVAGKLLFENKGNCTKCHSVDHKGGSLGPDLTDVGQRRNLKALEQSLLNPEAAVPLNYRAVQVITKSGQTITGIRLNEDDVSIQLRDTDENLRSFLKTNIREIRHDKPSLMPPYGSTLTKNELEDLVAYLNSLRGAQ